MVQSFDGKVLMIHQNEKLFVYGPSNSLSLIILVIGLGCIVKGNWTTI